jgi:hypothetical protein
LDLAEEVPATIDDLLVLVVASALEGAHDVGLPEERLTAQQYGRAAHLHDVMAKFAHGPLRACTVGKGADRVLQVDGAQTAQAAPHRGP